MKISPLVFIVICLAGCKPDEKETIQESPVKREIEIPSEFLAFSDKFHSDSIFQIEHIVFPVKSIKDDKIYSKENWIMHKPFNSQDGNFARSYNNLGGIIIEFVKERTGFVTIERRFSKMDGEYHLIYYDIESEFGESESN